MGRAGSEAAMLDIETASASAVALPSPPLPPPPPWSVVDMDAVRVIIAGRRATSPAQRRSVDRSLLGPSSLRSATTTGQKSCMTSFSGQDAFQRVSASSAQGGHPEAGAWSAEGLQSLLSFPHSSLWSEVRDNQPVPGVEVQSPGDGNEEPCSFRPCEDLGTPAGPLKVLSVGHRLSPRWHLTTCGSNDWTWSHLTCRSGQARPCCVVG